MENLFKSLYTTSFADYYTAIKKIRDELDEGKKSGITKDDFLMLLRPFYWYVHNPGFQDVIDICEGFMNLMKKYRDILLGEENPFTGNDFIAIGTFLAGYLDAGEFDTSGWKMLFGSPEIGCSVIAGKFSEQLSELKKPDADIAAIKKLAGLMQDIEGSKHICYWCLRHIGADFLESLEIMLYSFQPGDQTFILHALDAFPGNPAVIEFYKKYIEKITVDYLKEEAREYLKNVEQGN